MTIKPGQETELSAQFVMHQGMEGKHDFRIALKTNDPDHASKELTILSDWGG